MRELILLVIVIVVLVLLIPFLGSSKNIEYRDSHQAFVPDGSTLKIQYVKLIYSITSLSDNKVLVSSFPVSWEVQLCDPDCSGTFSPGLFTLHFERVEGGTIVEWPFGTIVFR